jgi:hypothetical protein
MIGDRPEGPKKASGLLCLDAFGVRRGIAALVFFCGRRKPLKNENMKAAIPRRTPKQPAMSISTEPV